MQDLVRKLDAVITTRVGYSGGDVAHATDRRHGTHAEAIEIVFDADRLSFRNLLEFFFQRLELMNWREVFGDTASAACSAPAHPQRPELGTRAFGLGPALWIERDDFAEIAQGFRPTLSRQQGAAQVRCDHRVHGLHQRRGRPRHCGAGTHAA
jgi:hypothetical protein